MLVIFLPKNIIVPQLVLYLPEKLTKFSNLHDICPNIPEFYTIIVRKILFPIFEGDAYVSEQRKH